MADGNTAKDGDARQKGTMQEGTPATRGGRKDHGTGPERQELKEREKRDKAKRTQTNLDYSWRVRIKARAKTTHTRRTEKKDNGN